MNTNSPSSSSRQEGLDSFSPYIAGKSGDGRDPPRRKRLKFTQLSQVSDPAHSTTSNLKPRARKKPDASAAKVTCPCSECGRRFWSWKALFGHMRCHPERQWRGINPPPNFRRVVSTEIASSSFLPQLTEEEHEIATSLLMLANGSTAFDVARCNPKSGEPSRTAMDSEPLDCQFECSNSRGIFGSQQALGVHRASHKNIEGGDFAVVRNGDAGKGKVKENEEEKMIKFLGHKCSICLRVFSSGKALGGHKKCHWEKRGATSSSTTKGCVLDLNLPAPQENEDLRAFGMSEL